MTPEVKQTTLPFKLRQAEIIKNAFLESPTDAVIFSDLRITRKNAEIIRYKLWIQLVDNFGLTPQEANQRLGKTARNQIVK